MQRPHPGGQGNALHKIPRNGVGVSSGAAAVNAPKSGISRLAALVLRKAVGTDLHNREPFDLHWQRGAGAVPNTRRMRAPPGHACHKIPSELFKL